MAQGPRTVIIGSNSLIRARLPQLRCPGTGLPAAPCAAAAYHSLAQALRGVGGRESLRSSGHVSQVPSQLGALGD